MFNVTRRQALAASGGVLGSLLLPQRFASAAVGSTLNIAYNVNLPSFDPQVGPSSVNPTIQAIYRSIFDQYVGQKPSLAFEPGLLTGWGWNDDKTKVWMDVRQNVVWHDGTPFTPEDVIWSIQREARPDSGNPVAFVWAGIDNFKVDGQRITADVKQFEPDLFKWMAFLTGYVLPKGYFEKVGPEGFEKKPVGTGPYMVDAYEGNAYLRLKANPKYWGGKPAFETVVFKFVPDATSRVAEIESGSSDVTLEIPYEEFDRLKGKAGLKGVCTPISDIGMIFITNGGVMDDKNVRLAMCHAVDKTDHHQAAAARLWRCHRHARSAGIRGIRPLDQGAVRPGAGGQAAGGERLFEGKAGQVHHPDDARLQAEGLRNDPGDRRHVAQRRHRRQYRDSTKSPSTSNCGCRTSSRRPRSTTGATRSAIRAPRPVMRCSRKSPHSAWHSDDLDAKIGPLWGEKDEKKRIAGWKAVDRYIAEQGYVLPLLQYAQPIVYKADLKVVAEQVGGPPADAGLKGLKLTRGMIALNFGHPAGWIVL